MQEAVLPVIWISYYLLHIQRGPWCPFPYLSSTFWAQNPNSVTRSYGINKEMNHNGLDEVRALEPRHPQSAHICMVDGAADFI